MNKSKQAVLFHLSISFFHNKQTKLTFLSLLHPSSRAKITEEKEKSEELLLNILPKSVVANLKHKKAEPEEFQDVTVLCADIAGFTDFCSNKSPVEVVYNLNQLFSLFDALVLSYPQLEKIKTVGDAYIVAAGLPVRSQDHATVVASFALDMLQAVKTFNMTRNIQWSIRIGMHTGSCVAGVMGVKSM